MVTDMKKQILLLLLPVVLVVSCGKDFTDLSPLSQRNVASFYKNQSDFEVGINGVYDALQSTGTYNNNYILLMEMRADNTINGGGATGLAASLEGIDKFNELPDNGQNQSAWDASYQGIQRANRLLSELDEADIEQGVKDRLRGEGLFLRSLLYYNLAVLYGNIPLRLEPVNSPDIELNQVDASTVYNQIAGDLETAASLLPPSYSAQFQGKATSFAAYTLLGKVYLTMGNKSDAETALRNVEGEFSLVQDFADLWGPGNEHNAESIFEVEFKSGGIGEGSRFTDIYTPLGEAGGVGGGNTPQDVTDDIVNAYDQNQDERFAATFELDADGNYYVEKFASTPFGPFDADNNWIEFRYADVLLMLAEAVGEGTEGYGYINQVRNRAELGNIGPTDPGTYEEKLLEERRREFAFENKRWPDLKRFGVAKQVMSQHLGLPESRITLLYPIPQEELTVSPELEQNPEHR